MTTFDVHHHLATARAAELRREACQARLAALVRCCRPSAWQRAVAATARRVAAVRSAVRPSSGPCCA